MTRTLFCLGDSNTYGYDPRSFFGDRYDRNDCWTSILDAMPEWSIFNAGANGRSIPSGYQATTLLRQITERRPDGIVVMLGSNDLLSGASAGETAEAMEVFLRQLPPIPTLLIAPPAMTAGAWVTGDSLIAESAALPRLYRQVADSLHILFADAGRWNISLTFDGVHFTEEGHRTFARQLAVLLPLLFA